MNLKTYLANLERGGSTRIANVLGISVSYLSQLASGDAAISPARCVQIEVATNGGVTRPDLRPNDWQSIWPELAALPDQSKINRDRDTPELLRELQQGTREVRPVDGMAE